MNFLLAPQILNSILSTWELHTASLSSQVFSVDVCSIGWRIIDQTRLSSNTPCTPTVFL